MKFVISWTIKDGGSAQANEASLVRALEAVAKWTPPEGQVFHQFLGRADGMGGYAVVETDNLDDIAMTCSLFAAYVDYQVHPVIEFDHGIELLNRVVEYRDALS